MPHHLLLAAWLALAGSGPAGAAPAADAAAAAVRRVALLPLENLASVGAARPAFADALVARLEARGFEVVRGEPVEAFLEPRRIRWLDSLLPDQLAALLDATGTEAALLGTILAYGRGDGSDGVALSLRLHGRDGALLWSGVQALTAQDTVGPLGLGRIEAPEGLAGQVVATLVASLPAPADLGRGLRAGPAGGRRPLVYRDPALPAGPLTVCVLPALNLTEGQEAPRILDAVLQQRLAERPGLRVVSPAELRRALVKLGLRAPSQLGPEQLAALGAELGTPYLLKPTLLAWGQGQTDEGEPTVEVELHLLLVDTVRDRVAWSGQARRDGAGYRGLFGRGAVHDTTSLSSRLVAELVQAFRP